MAKTYWYLRYPQGKTKAITLSYDDGVRGDIYLLELMKQYGFKGAFNINYNDIPKEKEYGRHRRLWLSAMKKLYASDHAEVAIHTYTHSHLNAMCGSEVMTEIVEDRRGLEKEFGGVIRGMAYPYGEYNDLVVEVARMAGICYARTVHSSHKFDLPEDWLRLSATCHHNDKSLMELAERFKNLKVCKEPKLFYLWGHAYEFEDNDNWVVIETFFREMQGLEDVWYATNIEIYDYVHAYEQLYFSADGQRVYNPTSFDVWLGSENATVCIPAGKTIDLK